MMPSSEALCASAGPGDEVADRVDARRGGAQRAVDLAPGRCSSELDARLVQAEPVDVGAAAGGDHEVVDLGRRPSP